MKELEGSKGGFRKVGPCLYRYRNGVYYARFKSGGKEIKCSLGTTDRKLAQRNLTRKKEAEAEVDHSQGKLTLEALCDRYLQTVQHQKPKTVQRKTFIVARIKTDWPTGKLIQIGKIKPSDVDLWLSDYNFGAASRNLHIACVRELFDMALRDRLISSPSPAAHLRSARRAKPIRLTPTFEQFNEIIANVRAQQFNADAQDSADFLEFLGLAGVGQAEAASLKRSDIDLRAGRIITFRHKTVTGFSIPIFPQVRLLLERLCQGKTQEELIFKIRDAKKALAGACRRLTLPAFSQRALRRMFITRAIEKGVDVKVIAEWQGHKDGGKLILDTYSHVNRAHSQRMAQLMTDDTGGNVSPSWT